VRGALAWEYSAQQLLHAYSDGLKRI
jgi:hypothetical protein